MGLDEGLSLNDAIFILCAIVEASLLCERGILRACSFTVRPVLGKPYSDIEPGTNDDKKYDIYKVPPKTLLSNENAKSDAEAAGPIVR